MGHPEAPQERPLRTAWRLYGNPVRLAAAMRKGYAILRNEGVSRLAIVTRNKLRRPQFPANLPDVEFRARLAFEERWTLRGAGLSLRHTVSIIIPTRGNLLKTSACLERIARSTRSEALVEIVIVNNGAALEGLPEIPFPVQVQPERQPFNWAAYNNRAARACAGEFLLFLNDDVLALHGGWIDALLAECADEQVGAVGAKLLYPSGQIQHLGISLDAGPEGGHVYKFHPRGFGGAEGELLLPRRVDAVTGACLLTPRRIWAQAGGFDEAFAENYNDVDYCLRLQNLGYATVVTPHAELAHEESATRPWRVAAGERQRFRARWRTQLPPGPIRR